jgi:hypothetical protein
MESSIHYEVEMLKGGKNLLFGGEVTLDYC